MCSVWSSPAVFALPGTSQSLFATEAELCSMTLRTYISLIQGVEEVHDGKHGQDVQVEAPHYPALRSGIDMGKLRAVVGRFDGGEVFRGYGGGGCGVFLVHGFDGSGTPRNLKGAEVGEISL